MHDNSDEKQSYADKLKDPRWQKKRLKILERDEFMCRECGNDKDTLIVHHISYNGNPWKIEDELLITLCEDCHIKEETYLKNGKNNIINNLRNAGLSYGMMNRFSQIFRNTNRGWWNYEPAIDILEMVINDDEIWDSLEKKFFERIKNGKAIH